MILEEIIFGEKVLYKWESEAIYTTPPSRSIEVNSPRHAAHPQTIQAHPHQTFINESSLRRDASSQTKQVSQ